MTGDQARDDMPFWTQDGLNMVHDSGERGDQPGVAVVAVHGFRSSPHDWRGLQDLDFFRTSDLDIFCFGYPSGTFAHCRLDDVAGMLGDEIASQITARQWRHLILLGHSQGGLLIRSMLALHPEVFDMTLRIVSLATPYLGSSLFLSYLLRGLDPFGRVLEQLRRLVSPVRETGIGYNQSLSGLGPGSAWTVDVADGFAGRLRKRSQAGQTLPSLQDWYCTGDGAIGTGDDIRNPNAVQNAILKSGGNNVLQHRVLKLIDRPHSLSTILTKAQKSAVFGRGLFTLSFESLTDGPEGPLIADIGRETRELIKRAEREVGSEDKPLFADGSAGAEGIAEHAAAARSQDGCFRRLLTLTLDSDRSSLVIVSGRGGVGKTTILRRLALEATFQLLGRNGSRPKGSVAGAAGSSGDLLLPLYIPLASINYRGERPANLWHGIASWWADFASKQRAALYPQTAESALAVEPAWVESLPGKVPLLLILDGLDEFALNNQIDREPLRKLLVDLSDRGKDGAARVVVVATARSGDPLLHSLAGIRTAERLEVAPLTSAMMTSIIPEALYRTIAKDLGDDESREVLHTPLVARWLAKIEPDHSLDGGRAQTDLDVLGIALRASLSLEREDLFSSRTNSRFDLLSVIGWYMLERQKLNVTKEEIQDGITLTLERWQTLPAIDRRAHQPFLDALENFQRDPVEFDITLAASVCEAVPSFDESELYRLHRTWLELCAAKLIVREMAVGILHTLSMRTFHPSLFRLIAQYQCQGAGTAFPEVPLGATLVRKAMADENQFVFGNLWAIVSFAPVPIEPDALTILASRFAEIPPLARHVALSALGYRAQKVPEGASSLWDTDRSRDEIRRTLINVLLEKAMDNGIPNRSELTRSLAWCLKRVLQPVADTPWPGFSLQDLDACFDMANPGFDVGPATKVRRSTLQVGYLDTARAGLRDTRRIIGSLHYLALAATALRQDGAPFRHTVEDFKRLFSPDSLILWRKIANHEPLVAPALNGLLDTGLAAWTEFASRTGADERACAD